MLAAGVGFAIAIAAGYHHQWVLIVELVLGVQFAPLLNFTNAHFGWFWKQYLDPSWTKAANAPPVPDQHERFGERQAKGAG